MKTYHTKLRSRRHYYLNLGTIIALLFVSTSFIGCSDDDDDNNWQKTNTDGRPSKIDTDGEGSVYFYYTNNKLIKQKRFDSSVSEYTYEKDELTKRFSYMTDPNIQDGSGESTFLRTGNKITVKSTGEPNGNYSFIQEIELGTNELPSRITNLGYKDNNEYEVPEQILYYSVFTYDTSDKILTKQEVYDVKTNKKVGTYTYEYDNNKGMISNNGLPAWYNIYMSTDLYSYMYLCTTNNVLKINVDDARYDKPIRSATFTYEYNAAKYPVKASGLINGNPFKQSIEY